MKTFPLIIITSLFFTFLSPTRANEGMWLPMLVERLNYVDMKKMGLNLTPEEIYSINNSSLKDAIVSLNDGSCTAELISPEGMMMTCYHCVHNYIQNHTTIENDYLRDGFVANTKKEELRNDDIAASFLIRIENVTERILSQVSEEMTEEDRAEIIADLSQIIAEQATDGTHYDAKVNSFYDGNEFYLFVYETYSDVRLVYAPPQQIGRFGGDSDNWTWPRNKPDFAMLRVYMSPTSEPAIYNKRNIPYASKHFLPISLKGIQKNDFAMVMGYPATTERFTTSYGVKLALEKTNPSIIRIRSKKQELMKEAMDENEEINIKYQSKYYESSNYWKYYIGQVENLKKLNVYATKKNQEDAFRKWVVEMAERRKYFGDALPIIEDAYQTLDRYTLFVEYFLEAMMSGSEMLYYAYTYNNFYNELKLSVNQDELRRLPNSLRYTAKNYFKNYDAELDRKIFIELLELFYNQVPKDQHPVVLGESFEKKYKNDFTEFGNKLYEKSIFADRDKILNFLMEPDYKLLEKDIGFQTMLSFLEKYKEIRKEYNAALRKLEKGKRLFVGGLLEMHKEGKLYPDANYTMRLSYGKVNDYKPSADKYFDYYTTIEDLMKKETENPTNPDYNTPEKLKKLIAAKDFGRYGYKGTLPTCFLTDNDVTGGVSGAPVLNANGEMIGIAFDVNWEATSVDIAFDPALQRTVCSDIRWVLFVIDKYSQAGHLIQEMKILE